MQYHFFATAIFLPQGLIPWDRACFPMERETAPHIHVRPRSRSLAPGTRDAVPGTGARCIFPPPWGPQCDHVAEHGGIPSIDAGQKKKFPLSKTEGKT